MLYLPESFSEMKGSSLLQATVVASLLVGALFGSFIFSKLAEKVGRKRSMLLMHIVGALGSLGLGLAPNLLSVILFRWFVGISVGGATVVVPMYITEISPVAIRGKVGSYIQFSITGGILCAYLLCYGFSLVPYEPWRWMFGFPGFLCLIPLLSMHFIEESPCWLVQNERIEEARSAWLKLGHPEEDVAIHLARATAPASLTKQSSWHSMFKHSFKPLILSCGVYIIQQLSGFNVFVYYSAVIFNGIGFDNRQALLASAVSSAPQMLVLTCSAFYLDRWGRKPPLLVSTGVLMLCQVALALCGKFFVGTAQQLGSVIIILIARVVFSLGLGAVPPIFSAELLPNEHRARGLALVSFCNWLTNGLVSFTFPPLVALETSVTHSKSGFFVYLMYALFLLSGFFIFYFCYEETKQKDLEENVSFKDEQEAFLPLASATVGAKETDPFLASSS